MASLAGKVMVITGAGSGIGRALALEGARRGARIAISDWNEESLAETAELAGGDVHSSQLDVSDRAAVAAYAADVADHFGKVNVLVNNAGVSLTGNFEEVSYEDFDWLMSINFTGVVNGTKEFLPHLIASGDANLVNISSLFGLISMPGQTAYNAAKFAVRGFTESLRGEMIINKHPVRVTCVHPGGIKTGIVTNGRVTDSEDLAHLSREFGARFAKVSPADAASAIIKGMLAGKPRILIGSDAHALHTLGRVLGPRYQDIIAFAKPRILKPAP